MIIGFAAWFVVRFVLTGFYTVDPSQRTVKTVFGRAQRWATARRLTTRSPIVARHGKGAVLLSADPGHRAGRPYFKWPWERVYRVSVATETANMAFDPESPEANRHGTVLEAVTKDQLNTGLTGQIRYQVSERNLYAYIFGVRNPIAHVMGYFVSVLRERIATFEAPGKTGSRRDAGRGVGRRHFDQRPAQEPPRPERAHGPGMRAVRRRATESCSTHR